MSKLTVSNFEKNQCLEISYDTQRFVNVQGICYRRHGLVTTKSKECKIKRNDKKHDMFLTKFLAEHKTV